MNQILHFDFIHWKARIQAWLSCAIFAGGLSCACPSFAQEIGLQLESSAQHSYCGTWLKSPASSSDRQPFDSQPTAIVETRFWQSPSSSDFPLGAAAVTGEKSASGPTETSSPSSLLTKAGLWISTQFEKLFGSSTKAGNGPDIKRMLGALSLVLGGYFALIWLLRLLTPNSNKALPSDVIEVLGKTPFNKGQYLQLVRLGNKLLLLLESNEGIQPIAEVTDPAEVHQLLTQCDPFTTSKRQKRSSGSRAVAAQPQVHSFRIPAVGQPESMNRLVTEAPSPTLADLIRVIEDATGKTEPKYRRSFEA